MTPKQFRAALAQLSCNHSEAARVLGIGRKSVLRYVSGEQEVPTVVERLLRMLLSHHVPEEWRHG